MQSIGQLRKAASLREFLLLLEWETIAKLAAVPVLLVLFSPIIQFLHNLGSVWTPFISLCQDLHTVSRPIGWIVLVLCLCKLSTEPKRSWLPENLTLGIFGAFVICILLSAAFHGFAIAATGYGENFMIYVEYITIYFVSGILMNFGNRRWVIGLFLSVSMVLAGLALVHFGITPISQFGAYLYRAPYSVFGNINYYAYFLTLAVLLSAGLAVQETNRYRRLFWIAAFLLNAVVMLLNQTMGGFVACVFGLLFQIVMLYIIHRRISWKAVGMLAAFLLLSVLIGLWYPSVMQNIISLFTDLSHITGADENADKAGSGRWGIWKHTIAMIGEKPLLGWGDAAFAEELFLRTGRIYHPHNEYLQYMGFFGLPAGLLYLAGILSIYLRALRRKAELDGVSCAVYTALFGYLVSAFFGNTLLDTAPFFFILLGIGYGGLMKKD